MVQKLRDVLIFVIDNIVLNTMCSLYQYDIQKICSIYNVTYQTDNVVSFYAFDSKLVFFFAYYVRVYVYRCTSFRFMYLLFCVFLLPFGVIKNNNNREWCLSVCLPITLFPCLHCLHCVAF